MLFAFLVTLLMWSFHERLLSIVTPRYLVFFYLFESLTMETITCFKRFFLVGDAYMFAFIRIELHFPGVFPLLETIEITL